MPTTVVANGSTLSFASASYTVLSITPTIGGAEIDRTHLASATKEYNTGLDDPSVVAEILGWNASIQRGAHGALSVTPAGGSASNCGASQFVVTQLEYTGVEVDGKMVTRVTFKPYAS